MMQLIIPGNYYMLFAFLLFFAASAILMVFYWAVFSKLAFYKSKRKLQACPPVSVIVCARNEYYKLGDNLPKLLEQDYPDYELILVNDGSDDDTIDLLTELKLKYSHLQVIDLDESLNFFRGKKFPLSIGIKSAKHSIVVLTDADCKPEGKNWLSGIVSGFDESTDIVLGYGKYEYKPGLLNAFVRYDTIHTAMQYLSLAIMGMPYMGVGRNLAYRKDLFYQQKGFVSHYGISSGDDDLFINSVARGRNTYVQLGPDSHTLSAPPMKWLEWIFKKRRHLTTGRKYRFKHKIVLAAYLSSQFIWFAALFVLLAMDFMTEAVLALTALKVLSHLLVSKLCMIRLREKKLLLFFPFIELFSMLFNTILFFINIFVKQPKWK